MHVGTNYATHGIQARIMLPMACRHELYRPGHGTLHADANDNTQTQRSQHQHGMIEYMHTTTSITHEHMLTLPLARVVAVMGMAHGLLWVMLTLPLARVVAVMGMAHGLLWVMLTLPFARVVAVTGMAHGLLWVMLTLPFARVVAVHRYIPADRHPLSAPTYRRISQCDDQRAYSVENYKYAPAQIDRHCR